MLLAGFPCQPFSIAGVSKKNALGRPHGFACEAQGTLFFDVARIIAHRQPKAFLLENVKNLVSHDKGNTFQVILNALSRELGYRVQYRVIDAKPFVPQHRERIFLVGFREETGFNFEDLNPPPKASWPKLKNILHAENGTESEEPPYTDGAKAAVSPKYTLTDNGTSFDDVVEASTLLAGSIAFGADGGAGDDILIGGGGADTLFRGIGDDVLIQYAVILPRPVPPGAGNQFFSGTTTMKYLLLVPLLILVPLAIWLMTLSQDRAVVKSPPNNGDAVSRFVGLGNHSRTVTTNPKAQVYFDQGLAFLYAFNHDEAIRSFEDVTTVEPECAMAHWGIAIASGGHINKPVVDAERMKRAHTAVTAAMAHRQSASAADQAMIEALAKRYADPLPEDLTVLDRDYSAAMKAAWQAHPTDADLGALYAESLMNLRPWDLWTHDGKPQPGTPEIVRTLEAVMALNANHPLALHLYIHALEASPEPGKADAAADRLRTLQPGLGHLVHMPSHIDVRRGRWQQAVEANERAIAADSEYRKQSAKQDFYRLYMAHNHHMLAFAAMQQGRSKTALDAVQTMLAGVPPEWVAVKENAAIADGFLAAPLEVMIRFGQWDAILAEKAPPEGFPIARGFWHHARGVAFAAKGQPAKARPELEALRAVAKSTPNEAHFGNNTAADLFAVADAMLEGEILASEGKLDESIRTLTAAVTKEDALRYDEPPDWVVPVRHALGAFLLKADRAAEAEAVYRADLTRWPENGWSLHGLSQSLSRQGRTAEAALMQKRFQEIWKHADISIDSSCLCSGRVTTPDK